MGIQGLLPLLKSIMVPIHIKELEGCSVAIDTYSWLHKGALSCSTQLCKGLPTSRAITYFSNILDSNDEALCAAACEALALVFESNCLEKFSSKTKDSNKDFKDNIIKQLRSRLSETGNERISSQDPRTGFNSASAALDFLELKEQSKANGAQNGASYYAPTQDLKSE